MISEVAQNPWLFESIPIFMRSATEGYPPNISMVCKECAVVLQMKKDKERILIGPVEYVKVVGHHGEARVKGKIDTGASRSSVDVRLAANIGLGQQSM